MKHTPEPWKVDPPIGAEHTEIRDQDSRRIAIVVGTYPMSVNSEDANAERIVACVNACAGIPTEVLTSGSPEWWGAYVARDRPAMEREIERLRANAEELSNALVKVIAHTGIPLHPTEDLFLGLVDSINRIAIAALKEYKGKA